MTVDQFVFLSQSQQIYDTYLATLIIISCLILRLSTGYVLD